MYYAELVTIYGTQTAYLYDTKDVDKKYPYTVEADDNGNSVVRKFSSQETLDAFVDFKNLESQVGNTVYLVLKNADFTEGRGPMLPHKAFASLMGAENYIAQQDGIYGSKQNRYITTGVNVDNQVYAYVVWNGYTIKPMDLE